MAAGIATSHPDIIYLILRQLDGPSLGSITCCSATLRHLSSEEKLWSDICHSTWPSTTSPRLRNLISTFPDGGARAFFSHAFPIVGERSSYRIQSSPPPSELISAVDIHHEDKLILTKTKETETVTDWFRCSPFRVDLLDPKDVVPTKIKHPKGDDPMSEMTLSWILIDPKGPRAVNVSSHSPVSGQRHWLTGEVQVRYVSIIGPVQCGIVVTCGGGEGGEMQVREISLQMEDMDGTQLNGKDSLVFLQEALEGKKGKGKTRVQEGKRRYKQYMQMKKERKERRMRRERALDMFCVAIGVSLFAAFCSFLMGKFGNSKESGGSYHF